MTLVYDSQNGWIDQATRKVAAQLGAISNHSAIEKQVFRLAYLCLEDLKCAKKVEIKHTKNSGIGENVVFAKSTLKNISSFPVWAGLIFAAKGYKVSFCAEGYKVEDLKERELVYLYTLMIISQVNVERSKTLEYLLNKFAYESFR